MDKDVKWLGCNECKHVNKNGTCKAFPGGIPIVFASGDIAHTEVAPGQTGEYVYDPKPPVNSKK